MLTTQEEIKEFLAIHYSNWLDKYDIDKTHSGICRFLEAAGKCAKTPTEKQTVEWLARTLDEVSNEELGVVGSIDRIP